MTNPPGAAPDSIAHWRALIDGYNRIGRAAPGYEAHLLLDCGQILTGEPHADMNCAFIGAPRDAERHLRIFHERASALGLPMLVICTEAAAPHVRTESASLGLAPAGEVPVMLCADPAPGPASTRYAVERIRDSVVLDEASPLAARAFGLPTAAVARVYNRESLAVPGVDYFVARRDGAVWSFVQTTRIGAWVGIWSMATPTEYQGQGAGRALLHAVLTWHRQRGADLFYLMASSAGYSLYQRVGFRETARLDAWLGGSGVSAQP